jgi:phospholipid/cholesterol/gamma-HCH transport system substrate-binding protein
MPSQQEVQWSQRKIGSIVLLSAAILMALVFLMASASGLGLFSRRLTVKTYFDNASGLQVGAAVNLDGVTIGTVKSITVVAAPERKLTPVQVVMKVSRQYQSSLHIDSTAALTTLGVLGDTVIDISSPVAVGPPLQDGDELRTLRTPTLEGVKDAGQATIDSMRQTLGRMDSVVDQIETGNGSLGKFMSNPDLGNTAGETIHQLSDVSEKLDSNDNSLGKALNALHNGSGPMKDTLARFNSITQGIQNGNGSAGKMLHDDSFQSRLSSAGAHANSLMSDVNAGKGNVGVLMKDPAVAHQLSDTLTKANALVSGINKGKGVAGILVDGSATRVDLNALQTESNSLLTMVRKDPKKYLTIEIRLF